ncbi:hypothetical protein GOBAR_DD01078 [Gossypium barbadense]|nr:hypothetical protein GOBAR_DD01078 [Gossypium barbadense]
MKHRQGYSAVVPASDTDTHQTSRWSRSSRDPTDEDEIASFHFFHDVLNLGILAVEKHIKGFCEAVLKSEVEGLSGVLGEHSFEGERVASEEIFGGPEGQKGSRENGFCVKGWFRVLGNDGA